MCGFILLTANQQEDERIIIKMIEEILKNDPKDLDIKLLKYFSESGY